MYKMKNKLITMIAIGIVALVGVQSVLADTILLSGDGWVIAGSNAHKTFSVSGVDLRVEIESYAYDNSSSSGIASSLSHDTGFSGFGVISAVGSTNLMDASISGHEMLTVTFNRNVTVSGYGMSDWSSGFGFTPKVYNFSPYAEIYLPISGGFIDSNGFKSFSFAGKPLIGTDFLRFFSMGDGVDGLGLASLDVTVNEVSVPEPATMLLLGFGILGLAGVRRFRK
jgi:hypothetical protein